jgi:hypothetical protein
MGKRRPGVIGGAGCVGRVNRSFFFNGRANVFSPAKPSKFLELIKRIFNE